MALAAAQDIAELVVDDAPYDPWKDMPFKDKLDTNKKPVIGILTQTLEDYMHDDKRFDGYKSYIMDSYVKYIEAHGARVVPLLTEESPEQIKNKLDHIDGVLFPGGDGDNLALGKLVFDEIVKRNDEGQFYPAWGICLGYENMINYTASAGWDALDHYELDTASLPLHFTKDPMHSRFYESLGPKAMEFMKHNFTYNSHEWGLNPKHMVTDEGLSKFWDLTAISFMPNNGTHPYPFVASIEAKHYPIFGTQYHPEKPSELWVDGKAINHSWESINLQSHFSELLVKMARANKNSFGGYTETQKFDISNYETIATEDQGPCWVF